MRVLCMGDNVVDRYLDRGLMHPGGNSVNVAVFLSRLGASSSYLGILGSDEPGQLVLRSLEAEGVDTSLIRVADGPNAYALVGLVEGDRQFLGSNKGVSLFDLSPADIEVAAGFDLVHTAYSARLTAQIPQLVAAGCRVCYDYGRDYDSDRIAKLPGLWLAAFSGAHLTPAQADETARAALGAGATYVVITTGARGATLYSGPNQWFHAAADVPVADTLGAGDAFLASMAFHLWHGHSPEASLAAATRLAGDVIGEMGALGHAMTDRRAPVFEGVQ